MLISRERVCLLVRRSLLSLGPGAEGRSHYLGGGSPLRLPPRAGLRAADEDEERTRVSRGLSGSSPSQRSREQTQNKNNIVDPTALPSPSASV
eukprot:scaffold21571_cov120-Isochrysis_galbana.AAC.4